MSFLRSRILFHCMCGLALLHGQSRSEAREVKLWTPVEIVLQAEESHTNSYTDVECWVTLKGPDFGRRVYGFWDGENVFKIRVVATAPGYWSWETGSNTSDPGLNSKQGAFTAVDWSEAEREANPNRRGFLRATSNGRALEYADGTSFFLLADTWWASSTWRYPMKHKPVSEDYVPKGDIGFEEAVRFNKRRGYNGLTMIASFPNWHNDGHPSRLKDVDGVGIRSCDSWKDNQTGGAKDMRDQKGNRPFHFPGKAPTLGEVCADFDRLNPAYFQSLDEKMEHISREGFVPFFETVRRDHIPSWRAYHDFETSFPRYVQYLAARYGCYNLLFSVAHQDSGAHRINEALNAWYHRYGGLPFGQPTTALAAKSTLLLYGHGDESPWLTLHGIGNHTPRLNLAILHMEEIFRQSPPYPAITQEAYYPGARNRWNLGTHVDYPATDSPRDQYFARLHAYGGVLSGGLGGHIYGTNAWDGDVAAVEPRSEKFGEGNEYIYEALQFESAAQMPHLRTFILSQGDRYQDLELAVEDLEPRSFTADATGRSMSGLAFMMRTPDKSLAMLYFEESCGLPVLKSMAPNSIYRFDWFDPRTGHWMAEDTRTVQSGGDGRIKIESFPGGLQRTRQNEDWALKLTMFQGRK